MAELIQHPAVEITPGQRVLLVAVDNSPASDSALRFAIKEHSKPGDFVQVLYVIGAHLTAQSSLSESPLEPFTVVCGEGLLTQLRKQKCVLGNPISHFNGLRRPISLRITISLLSSGWTSRSPIPRMSLQRTSSSRGWSRSSRSPGCVSPRCHADASPNFTPHGAAGGRLGPEATFPPLTMRAAHLPHQRGPLEQLRGGRWEGATAPPTAVHPEWEESRRVFRLGARGLTALFHPRPRRSSSRTPTT